VLLSGGTTLADTQVNREEAALLPRSELITLPANHWPLTEAPEETREAIEDWLERTFGSMAGPEVPAQSVPAVERLGE
jgi:pimeloyl-ACP methyl ester carboxylesterase